MKKILLIPLVLLSLQAVAQRHGTAAEQLDQARPYFIKDPCSATGMAWVKGALKKEPDNVEALEIISRCDKFKYETAKMILAKDSTSFKAYGLLQSLLEKQPEDEELNYLLAKIKPGPQWWFSLFFETY